MLGKYNLLLILLYVFGVVPVTGICSMDLSMVSLDTIPPEIISPANDLVVECSNSTTTLLADWYNNAGGMMVQDDSGVVSTSATIELDSVVQIYLNASENFCGNTGKVEVGFFALDTCGNSSIDTSYALFMSVDNTKPKISTPATSKFNVLCNNSTDSVLIDWINNLGNGAQATDDCSDTLIWERFVWQDNAGNSGSGIINQGPYFPISREVCNWSVNVSFIVEDLCGNIQATTASFSILDTISPIIISDLPADTMVSCESVPPPVDIIAEDQCEGTILAEIEEFSTRSDNPEDCGFLNYTITRNYFLNDACDFSFMHTQVITVTDTIQPGFIVPPDIIVNCSETGDTSITGSPTAIIDNCENNLEIGFTDDIMTGDCEFMITRFWQLSDACGNATIIPQIITVQDIDPPTFTLLPRDTMVSCDGDIEIAFSAWIEENGFAEVEDECNEVNWFAAAAGSYDLENPETFPGNQDYETIDFICEEGQDTLQIIQVDFVAYDFCNNASASSARFITIDTTGPLLLSIPDSFEVIADLDTCGSMVNLPLPALEDNCSDNNNTLAYFVQINEGPGFILDPISSVDTFLSVGSYSIFYAVTDCGGNSVTATYSIEIMDQQPPLISCGQDQTLYVDSEQCQLEYLISDHPELSDACGFTGFRVIESPENEEEALIPFVFSIEQNDFIASNLQYTFNNLRPTAFSGDVLLKIYLRGDIDDPSEYFSILGDDGSTLGTTQIGQPNVTAGTCDSLSTTSIEIDKEVFNNWAIDGEITFTAVLNSNASDVINPCDPGQVIQNGDTDGSSAMFLALEYTSNDIQYFISRENNVIQDTSNYYPDEFPKTILDLGTSAIHFIVRDSSGNTAMCSYNVELRDTIKPEIECQNLLIEIHPSGLVPVSLDTMDLLVSMSDNCGISSITYSQQIFNCEEVGTEIPIMVEVSDASGNVTFCSTSVRTIAQEISPSFSVAICGNDTLKLFANPPPSPGGNIYTYQWSGPNNFSSSLENPIILNADGSYSGKYTLEIEGFNGCSSFAELSVFIEDLSTPSIDIPSSQICGGESTILNATTFTGDIQYEWYEGVFPNGILLGTTDGASFLIEPPVGQHFYYVVANSENCISNPSNGVILEVSSKPTAAVSNPFIITCEGEQLQLSPLTSGPGVVYNWFGPNSFFTQEKSPVISMSANASDQGIYKLVVSENGCSSDTAFVQVVIFDKPERPMINTEGLFCEEGTIIMSVNNVTNGDQYYWLRNGSLFSTQNSNSLLITNGQDIHEGLWSVVVENGICLSDTSEVVEITVENNIEIGAGNDGPVCEGDSVQLNVSFLPNAEYQWTGPNGFNSNQRNPKIAAVEGVYNVEVVTTAGCQNEASTEVEIIDVPVITALSNSAFRCMDGETDVTLVPTIFPPGDYNYFWSGPNNFQSNQSMPVIPDFSSADNGLYLLLVSNGSCISSPAFTNIEVTNIPSAPVLTGPNKLCEGDDALFRITSNIQTAELFIWETPSGVFTSASSSWLVEDARISDIGSYSVSVSTNGCNSTPSNRIILDIRPQPVPPLPNSNSPVCNGDEINLSSAFISGASYEWVGPIGFFSTARNPIIFNADEDNEGDYRVRILLDECPSDFSEPVFVEVIESIQTPVLLNTELSVCDQQNLSFIELCLDPDQMVNGAIYHWSLLGSNTSLGSTPSSCLVVEDPSLLSLGINGAVAIAQLDNCFSEPSATLIINVLKAPDEIAYAGEDLVACDESDILLMAEENQVLNGTWSAIDPFISFLDETDPNTRVSGLSIGDNKLIWTLKDNICGDISQDTIIITLESPPIAIADQYSTDYNTEVELNPIVNDEFLYEVRLEILDPPISGSLDTSGNQFIYKPSSTFIGQERLRYRICNIRCPEFCSTESIEIQVGENSDCFASNVLTPNGDGINDRMIIPCLESGEYNNNQFVIFNIWGYEVFSANAYSNDWEGTYNGETLPVGTYYYLLELKDGTPPLRGFLVIEQ